MTVSFPASQPAVPSEFAFDIARRSALSVHPGQLSSSEAWHHEAGELRHRTGRFFQIAAIRHRDGECPIIVQKEVGTLGFLIRDNGGMVEICTYGKVEPGNVNICQLAPTCQATLSNLDRAHGGALPPFAAHFAEAKGPRLVSSSLQSEQGTRFLQKQNLNIVKKLDPSHLDDLPGTHLWVPTRSLLACLSQDYLVNTDARSVLITSDWSALIDDEPFREGRNGSYFAAGLHSSYHIAGSSEEEVRRARKALSHARQNTAQPPDQIPIRELQHWRLTPRGLETERPGGFEVLHYSVNVKYREVESWDQPLVSSRGEGEICLVCAEIDGVLKFLFRVCQEPGLISRAELTPTICVAPGETLETADYAQEAELIETAVLKDSEVVLECKQSEEGGRFFLDTNRYRLVLLGSPPNLNSQKWVWLSVKSVAHLLRQDRVFTNEARSGLSLLLPYL